MYDYKAPLETMFQPRPKPRSGKGTLIKAAAAFGALALVGVAGVAVASRCGYALHLREPASVGAVEAVQFREQFPAIFRRENADAPVDGLKPYDYSAPVGTTVSSSVVSGGAAARATGADALEETDFPVGISTPITTQASSLNTVYSVRTTDSNDTQTSTTTLTSTVVIVPSKTHSCTSSGPDQTETVVFTVTIVPQKSHTLTYGTPASDITVIGDPTTVTDVQTDVSYTGGAPDATVSGTPATVTDVQTDTRYTSGAPDATVSGEPATVTAVITNTAGEPMTTLTFTSINTVFVTVTTATRSSVDFDSSVLGMPYSTTSGSSSSSRVTHTKTVTVTGGPPVTSITTVELPPPYGNGLPTTYGTGLPINATTMPTFVPPVFSAGTKGCGRSVAYFIITVVAGMWLF
ncbi:hypothetical protein V2A60_005611 [Cordyceps javanica]